MIGKSVLNQYLVNPNNQPPFYCLEAIPILDAKDNPCKISYYLLGNYLSEVDFGYIYGFPQMIYFLSPNTEFFINTRQN